jgi:hypothetical protein
MAARDLLDKIITEGESEQDGPRALALPAIRPYLPDAHTLRRLLAGHIVLARMTGRAARAALRRATTPKPAKREANTTEQARPGLKDAKAAEQAKPDAKGKEKAPKGSPLEDAAERAGIAVLGAIVLGAAAVGAARAAASGLRPYLPIIVSVAAAALLTAAWAVAPDLPHTTPEPGPAAPVGARPLDPRAAFAQWLLQTIGDRPGIHLRDLYPAMRSLPGRSGLDDTALRAWLTGLGVPVVRSLRVGGVAGRSGVRQADVLALLSPTESGPGEQSGDAGQSTDSPQLSVVGEEVKTA